MYEYMNYVRGTATSREKAVLYLEVSENLVPQNTIDICPSSSYGFGVVAYAFQ
jgi:hypothetical protein